MSEHRVATPEYERFVFYADNDYGYIREPKKVIKKVIEKTGISFSLHDLRRTFTSIAESLSLGSSYTLKRLLNHKTDRNDVTAGYTILTAEELREPAQEIENKMLELAGIKEAPEPVNQQVLELLNGLTHAQQMELVAKLAQQMNFSG